MSVSDDLNGLNNLPFLGVRPLDVTVIDSFSALLASVNYLTEHTVSDTVSIKNTHRLPLKLISAVGFSPAEKGYLLSSRLIALLSH